MKKYILWLFILTVGQGLQAEQTAYITDSLRLRVYVEPNDASEIVQTLDSGDSIELLETQGSFSKVRTYDGTVGWVKSAFVVTEPPEKLLYYSVSEENEKLKEKIESLQSGSNSPNDDRVEKLKQTLAEQQNTNKILQAQIEALQKNISQNKLDINSSELKNHEELTDQANFINYKFLLIIAAIVLLLGFWLGINISSMRMRKRLHGYKLE